MKNKTTAALLAFFLGSFGVHRFYLGQGLLGFLYLIFIWSTIPVFISIIDCIIFLTMSEEKFNMKYNPIQYAMATNRNQAQPNIIINNTHNQGTNPYRSDAPPIHSNQQQQPRPTATPSNRERKNPFIVSGDEKYANYDFDGALEDYRKVLNMNPRDFETHFKLACLYSIMENVDSSYFHLSKAVECGFSDLERIRIHDHLSYLRTQPSFDNFVRNGYQVSNISLLENSAEETLNLSDDVFSKIERLAKMKDQGIITEDEFAAQKTKLLG